jgi:hypothetical protein
MKYRKKPVVIDALLWTGYNYTESEMFMEEGLSQGQYEPAAPDRGNGWLDGAYSNSAKLVTTLEGVMLCQPGDWIIKGVKGEFYPCKPDIFEATYEKVFL